jgi:hypothetical protein
LHWVTSQNDLVIRKLVMSNFTVSSTNKTDRHNMTEILLKVALNTINQTKPVIRELLMNDFTVHQVNDISGI